MKNMRKLFALALAVMMVMSLATTAFAAAGDVKLTIATTHGHTYKVYQLLTGEVSALTNGSGTLSNTAAGANAKTGATAESIDAALKDEDDNYLSGAALGDAAYSQINTDSDPVQTVTGDGTEKTVGVAPGYYVVVDTWTNGTEIAGETLSRYLVAVVGDTTMTPKATTVELDKKIIDTDANAAIDDSDKTDTAAIGDTIEFEITGTVPETAGYKYFYYVAHDTLSKGLTLNENSFAVTVGGDTLTKGTDYYVYVTKNEETGVTIFELAFEDMKKLVDNGTIAVGEAISIKYKATVNDDAEIGKIPNTNDVYPIYSNNPGDSERNDVEGDNPKPGIPKPGTAVGEGPTKTTKTYVTELTIQKVDENGMPLEGAEFTLTGENLNKVIITTATEFKEPGEGETAEYYELNDGTFTTKAPTATTYKERGDVTELSQLYELGADGKYTLTSDSALNEDKTYYVVDVLSNSDLYKNPDAPTHVRVTTLTTTTATAEESTKKVVGTVDKAGLVTFTGLNAGAYTLTETKTPEGYNTIEPINFTISATTSDSTTAVGGSITWASDNDAIVLDTANGVFNATIVNVSGAKLPSTGGMGTTMFYLFGGIMVLAAVVLLVTKKRMSIAE